MSKTRAFLEMAARFRPKLQRQQMKWPSSTELAQAERRNKPVRDPYEAEIMAAQGAPEVHGGRALTYMDPARPHGSDPFGGLEGVGAPSPTRPPKPLRDTHVPGAHGYQDDAPTVVRSGAPKPDGDDHGW